MIIVSGCSFLAYRAKVLAPRFGTDNIKNYAAYGAGNDYISASIVDAVLRSTEKIDYVFVLWTGIMRYDLEVGKTVMPMVGSDYMFKSALAKSYYVHSGGTLGSWNELEESPYKEFVDMFYHEHNREFHTDRTVNNMFIAKCVLESHNIPYDFGFIYNPHDVDGVQESSLGSAAYDITKYYNIKSSPLAFCTDNNMLGADNFHPSETGLSEWLDSIKLKID